MMKSLTFVSALLLSASLIASAAPAQDAAPAAKKSPYVSTIGEVVSIDGAGKQLKVKTDKGEEVGIGLEDNTSYLRMPPGEKDLKKAVRIELKDIAQGDRVLARTRTLEGAKLSPATSIIVMTKADLAQYHEKTREEWEKRGTVGTVASLDPATKAITITVPNGLNPKETKSIAVDPADKIVYRRYAPGSAKFQDAKPSTFDAIKLGDRIRILGDKNEDGTHIKPEEIVSGTFRTLAATIISIDPATNTAKVNDLATKKPVTVTFNADSSLKRLPQRMAMFMAAVQNGGSGAMAAMAGGQGQGGGTRRPPTAEGAAPGAAPGGAAGGPGGPGGPGGFGAMRGNGANLPKMIEALPQIPLTELKAGDALVISAAAGNDASEVTAITAVAGVEAILASPTRGGGGQSAVGGSWSFGDIGMPQ
jgi:hypothetical protein